MAVRELIQFERLREDESLTSPSGRFVLHYDADGVAVVTDRRVGEVRWRAGEDDRPAVGRLLLGGDGSIHVEALGDGEVVWRSGFAAPAAHALVVTDDGDFDLLDGQRVRLLNSRTGPVEAAGLGDAAPVAAITGERFLVLEGKKRRTVVRNPDGTLQVSTHGRSFGWSHTLPVPLVRWMEQPDTVLTWRILPYGDRRTRELCLVDADGEVLWRDGMRDSPAVPPPARAHVHGGPELGRGGRLRQPPGGIPASAGAQGRRPRGLPCRGHAPGVPAQYVASGQEYPGFGAGIAARLATDAEPVTSACALMRQNLQRLLERGRHAGVARADVDAQEVLILVSAVTGAARTSPGSQAADRESRFVDVGTRGDRAA